MSEKTAISIKSKSVSFCESKPSNRFPVANRFMVIPKKKPQLAEFIKKASWNCVTKTINLEILETLAFSAFDWINNINLIRKALKKSPFGDIEQDFLIFKFFDEKDVLVKNLKFKGLELKNHECNLNKNDEKHLLHCLSIEYDSIEIIQENYDCEN